MKASFLPALVALAASLPTLAQDVTIRPNASGGTRVMDASGTVTRMRIGEDGLLFLPGTISMGATTATGGTLEKPGGIFLHDYGTQNTFLGVGSGNLSLTGT